MKRFAFFLFPILIQSTLFSQCIEEIAEQNVYCGWQGKSASASIDHGFVFKGSYLYWQAKEDGLEYAQNLDLTVDFPNPIVANLELFEPESKWNSGFQAGAGYIFSGRSQWDLFLNWTSFNSRASGSVSANDSTLNERMVRATWLPFLLGVLAFDGAAVWNLKYNILDFTLGRDFFIGKWLSFHPQAGVRAAWLDQNYQAKYHSAIADGMGGLVPLGETRFQAKWSYDGAGIRLGTDAEWHWNSCFSFVANGFASILYGKHQLQELFSGAFVAGPGILISEIINLNNDYYRLRTAFETELGVRFQRFFCNGTRKVLLGGYYGFSYWIHQNAMVNQFLVFDSTGNALVTNLPTMGDLQLQGLRIELEVDF